jgi:uncharacterized protein (TIGR03083 family)
MHVDHDAAASAFREQLATLLRVGTNLDDRALLAASRCHGWTVADVLVHLHFGLQEMLLGTLSTTDDAADTDAASYWREAPADGPDALDQVQLARSIASAYRPPTGLVRHVCITADALNRAVARLDAGTVRFQGRVLPTGDFLATWAVELAVHHLDLNRELDLAPPAPAALSMARATVEALAGDALPASWSDEAAVLAGAGRLPLTDIQRREIGELGDRLPAL